MEAGQSAKHRKGTEDDRVTLQGDPPSPIDPPPGCHFAPRCPFAVDDCHVHKPHLREVKEGHLVACHLVDENCVPPHARTAAEYSAAATDKIPRRRRTGGGAFNNTKKRGDPRDAYRHGRHAP